MLGTVWSSKLYFTTNINLKVSPRSLIGVGYLGNIYNHYEKKVTIKTLSMIDWHSMNDQRDEGKFVFDRTIIREGPLEP